MSEDSSITNPDGTTGALKMTATAGNSRHDMLRQSSSSTTNRAFSVFVKKGNHRYIGLCQGGQSNNIHVIFDTDTKTITDNGAHNNGTFVSSGFEEYANGWFRIHLVGFTSGGGLRAFLAGSASQNGLKNWSASGDEFAYVWGVQKEAGTFPTSYIPTSGSAVTRAADVVEITGTNFSSFYNQSEGTMFAEFNVIGFGYFPRVYEYQDGTSTGENHHLYSSTNQTPVLKARTKNGGNTQVDFASVSVSTDTPLKTAYGYKVNDFGFTLNGATPSLDTTGSIPTGIDRLTIGNREDSVNPLTGHIKRLSYFPTRLADATLQSITS